MNQVKIDIMAFRGAREAWPAHVYQVLREAGFRLKPLDTADPSHEQVAAAIDSPPAARPAMSSAVVANGYRTSSPTALA